MAVTPCQASSCCGKRQLVEGLTDLSRPLLVGPAAGLVVLPLLLPLLAFLNPDTMALGQ